MNNDNNLVKFERKIRYYDENNHKFSETSTYIQPWQLVDLAYESVTHSYDYRGKSIINDNDFNVLLLMTSKYLIAKNDEFLNNEQNSKKLCLFINAISSEQFKYQTKYFYLSNLVRELYIIFDLGEKFFKNINYHEEFKEEIGVSPETAIAVLMTIFMISFFDQNILKAYDYLVLPDNNDKQDAFDKVIKYYSATRDEIKNNNDLGRQIFYTKPYIINQFNETLSVSIYLNQFIIEHAPLWILRNFYMKKEDNKKGEFSKNFGFLFEKYFEELCNFYKVKKERISEDKRKRADWMLEFDNYVFLIEQKSSIYSLSLKQQTPDIDRFEQDIKNKLLKGIKQLDTTADELNLKSSIKILLYYDDFFDPNILTEALNDADCKISDDNFFIANIIEMEMLLELSSCDKKLFDGVVEEMIKIKNLNTLKTYLY